MGSEDSGGFAVDGEEDEQANEGDEGEDSQDDAEGDVVEGDGEHEDVDGGGYGDADVGEVEKNCQDRGERAAEDHRGEEDENFGENAVHEGAACCLAIFRRFALGPAGGGAYWRGWDMESPFFPRVVC